MASEYSTPLGHSKSYFSFYGFWSHLATDLKKDAGSRIMRTLGLQLQYIFVILHAISYVTTSYVAI